MKSDFVYRYLIPRIPRSEISDVLKTTCAGAAISGSYGILHDQVTFAIGPEYYHNFKFHQFQYADFGLPDLVFVSVIGFLATWWVGAIVGWIVSRRVLPNQSRAAAYRQIRLAFVLVFGCGCLAGASGWLYGLWRGPDADYSAWQTVLDQKGVTDTYRFMRVSLETIVVAKVVKTFGISL